MDSRLKVDLSLQAEALPQFLGLNAIVHIKMHHSIEELFQEANGQETLIRVLPSTSPSQLISLNLHNCSAHHVYQLLLLHHLDPALCDLLAQKISSAASGMCFGLQGFLMLLEVNLVREVLFALDVDSGNDGLNNGGETSDVIEKLKKERSFKCDEIHQTDKSCTVCLEEFSRAETLTELPCSHVFHESCVVQWLQTKNSCPLCRRVPYEDVAI